MPLSEHEQRMLDEIESALYEEDPKFATTVRKSSNAGPGRVDVKVIVVGVLGAVVLVGGLAVPIGGFPVVSLLGFVLMFVAGVMFLRGRDKGGSGSGASGQSGSGPSNGGPKSGGSGSSGSRPSGRGPGSGGSGSGGNRGFGGGRGGGGGRGFGGRGGIGGSSNGPSYTERMEDRFRKRFGEGDSF